MVKKFIFCDKRIIFVAGSFLLCTVAAIYQGQFRLDSLINLLAEMLCIGAFALFVYSYFVPLTEYDDEKITYSRSKKTLFYWSDVRSVVNPVMGHHAVIIAKNGRFYIMAAMGTRDFFTVLADVLEKIKKKNPNADIDPKIQKWAQKPPRFYFI